MAVPGFGKDDFINVYCLRTRDIFLQLIDQTVVHGIGAEPAGTPIEAVIIGIILVPAFGGAAGQNLAAFGANEEST
ncbi:hypothetical protein ACX0G9_17565 [Flavitalea flava]